LSDRAHLLFGVHKIVDGFREQDLLQGSGKNIGTTKQGIGPCYAYKMQRINIRVCDLREFQEFETKFRRLVAVARKEFGDFPYDVDSEIEKYKKIAERVIPMIVDGVLFINEALRQNKKILIEGANAVMLDIDFGTYPYVTSSSASIGGVCTGLGIPPKYLTNIVGIVKAYTTRVGEGPFLSEDTGKVGLALQTIGREVGTTTGRQRRCGWIDITQLRYSSMLNGYSQIAMTKLDVLDTFSEIKIVTGYSLDGELQQSYPSSLNVLTKCEPVYQIVPGWNVSIAEAREYSDLPENARNYVELIERLVGVPITCIGVGPKRDEIVFKPISK